MHSTFWPPQLAPQGGSRPHGHHGHHHAHAGTAAAASNGPATGSGANDSIGQQIEGIISSALGSVSG
jgi:hypothetical protein